MSPTARPITQPPASGARVEIRDEEWMVRSVKSASTGGLAVHVTGLSELVRNKRYIFLDALDEIRELRPEETKLVHDSSPLYRRSRLYLESLLRRTSPTDNALYLGPKAAIDRTMYQLQPAAKALCQPRPRILMADGVGLGKTIEVGVLLTELIERGRGDRILVVALKSILAQFQQEMWARFTIPLVRLDSAGIQRLQAKIPSNMNPFYHYDRVIISVDTLKKDEKYRRYLEDCRWDVIVVDECQNVAVRGASGNQRARLAQLLARTCDALVLTSATPHDGRAESFASLVNLLEPTAIADTSDYTADDVRDYFVRRFKKDIRHEIAEAFHDRVISLERTTASDTENAAFAGLADVEFRTIDRERNNKGVLFRTLLLKAFLSSPVACAATVQSRLRHKDMQTTGDPAVDHDRTVLERLHALVNAVTHDRFGKYQRLLALLREMGMHAKGNTERVVIFSERIDTLSFLHERLRADLALPAAAIAVFHGTLDDVDQTALVKKFGIESSDIRILLASDAASEGVNLHYYCHRMIHFDLPWSFIRLEQRNGRIDRFGQKNQPLITYLLTIPGSEKLQGDLRVLERLIEKEENAQKNLGDVAWLLNLHEAAAEEEHIARGIEEGKTPEAIIPEEAEHTDFMDLLLGEEQRPEAVPTIKEPLRLYQDDIAYARDAFSLILGDAVTDAVEWHDHLDGSFTLTPPEDLLRRFELLPVELQRDAAELKLTTDRQRVMEALEAAREESDRWPEWQLFWERHPVGEWLDDRVLAEFTRHEAPVMRLAGGVAAGERVYLFQGIVSNQRSQPVIVDWFGVSLLKGKSTVRSLNEILEGTGLRAGATNPTGKVSDKLMVDLGAELPDAVRVARDHMASLRNERAARFAQSLQEGIRALNRWREARHKKDEAYRSAVLARGSHLSTLDQKRLKLEREESDRLYAHRKEWVETTMMTQKEAYVRLAAVLVPMER